MSNIKSIVSTNCVPFVALFLLAGFGEATEKKNENEKDNENTLGIISLHRLRYDQESYRLRQNW